MDSRRTYEDLIFLEDEVRDGFHIPTPVKQAWWEEIYILKEIDRVCSRHGIKYFADWGTLLATVRHGGYIPWDDDLDICMKRSDYERFRQVADELPEDFFIQDYTNTDDHWYFIAKVVAKNSISFDETHLSRYNNFPYMVNVDIFIMDNIYADHDREVRRDRDTLSVIALADGVVEHTISDESAVEMLDRVNRFFDTALSFDDRSDGGRHDLAVSLYDLAEKLMAQAPDAESDQVMNLFPWGLRNGYGRPKYLYDRTVRLPYENITIPVSYMYNREASMYYGDYMQVVKNWNGHDYPFFAGQKANLEELNGGPLPTDFFFTGDMLRHAYPSESRAPHAVRQVLFAVCGRDRWKALLPFLMDEINEGSEITVVYLPFYFKDPEGVIMPSDELLDRQLAAAREEMPEEFVPYFLSDYDAYDLTEQQPDAVYICDPYDDRNPCLSIPPQFYTSHLQQVTDIIAYVSPYATADFDDSSNPDMSALRMYVDEPAMIRSDWIFVQTDNMRRHYIDELSRFTGEEMREYWTNVVQVYEAAEQKHGDKELYCIGLSRFTESDDNAADIAAGVEIPADADVFMFPPYMDEWERFVGKEVTQQLCKYQTVTFSDDFVTRKNQLEKYGSYSGDPSPLAIEFRL